MRRFGGTWIASALSPEDHELARTAADGTDVDGYSLRFLDLDPDTHRLHYDVVSNEHLWFVFHYLFDLPTAPLFDASFDRAWDAYLGVNGSYAQAVGRLRPAGPVLVQDYHLLAVGNELRKRRWTGGPLVYFHHVPWPEPDYFSLLPARIVSDVLRGVLAHDVVGFHARRWADRFLACCERLLRGVSVGAEAVRFQGRDVRVVVAPVPLDVPLLREQSVALPTERWIERIDKQRAGRHLLVRVDRIELSKNVLRGFLAFEQLLARRPSAAADVLFVALQYMSRPRVAEYRRYVGRCMAVVQQINERFARGSADEGPLSLSILDDYSRSLAGLRLADTLLVNPVYDGLNVIAKQGCVLTDRDAVLVLSRNAGVWEELGSAALGVNPFDVSDTADALDTALDMSGAERARRARRLRKLASIATPESWVRTLLDAAP